MLRKCILLALVLAPLAGFSQKKDKDAEKFSSFIDATEMKKHLYTIASKEMGGRDTPSPGLEKAAVYIEEQIQALGLIPANNGSYRQYYTLYRDSMTGSLLTVNGKTLELNNDYQPLANNYAAGMRFSEVVFAGYGIVDGDKRDDYAGLKVAGKMVMILDGMPSGYKPSTTGFQSPGSSFGKMNAAMANGATALLIVYNNFPRKQMNTTSNWSPNGFRASQAPFTFSISPTTAASIVGQPGTDILSKAKEGTFTKGIYKTETELQFSKVSKSTQVSNVMGMIEGTDKKDEYVFITAHYDHVGMRNDTTIYYGADDDGSGSTGVIELAQAFAKAKAAGKGPRRNIVFMWVSGEEKGLWGSKYYTDHPVFPLEKTTVDLNIDMIGRTGTDFLKSKDSVNYVYIIGDDKLSSDLTPITDEVNGTYSKMNLDRKYNDPNDPNRFYFRSDHYNFAEKGVPVIFYFNGVHADYHKPTDTPDKINYDLMEKRAKLIFHTAWVMSNREEMLKRDRKLERPKAF
jgi:hypothetical protein